MSYDIPPELKLTTAERDELSEKARQYVAALEKKVDEYQYALRDTNDELRRKRFAYWNNRR